MRFLGTFILGGIFGMAGGAALMLILFPFLFPPPMVNELVEQDSGAVVLSETEFLQNVDGHDPAHWGRGDVKVYLDAKGDYLIEFQANFEVGPGPNFWLYVNTRDDIQNEVEFLADESRKRIDKIKSFRGSQVYKVAKEDMANVEAITIWCESFNQYIASANLSVG